ncbi:MAG: hypothetical protein FWC14_01045 [Candidatus Bathyarchaeota archaeon]|uniref:hypothetical protein n=1 Tax=Candidatus Bathycorpusculum sp. TaxID=2994959 RepID=UPI002834D6A5|nr:hypothetical protein [Candidatus Termiticorpusculum sp.]
MDEKIIIRKFEQKLIVCVFLLGGLAIVAISVIFPVFLYSVESTWKLGLIFGSIGTVSSIIGWLLKKKYQVSFS